MEKIDSTVLDAFKQSKGREPEEYIYVEKAPPLWLMILLAGGLFSAILIKPLMMGSFGDSYYFIPTGVWNHKKLRPAEAFQINKSDIKEVKFFKFGPARYFKLILQDGRKVRLRANIMYRKLEKQQENLPKIIRMLGGTY